MSNLPSDREILAQAYEAVQPNGWAASIRKGSQQFGHTSFIDVNIALDAMVRLRNYLKEYPDARR